MEARLVDVETVRSFFAMHPHPNVLEPLAKADKKRFLALYDGDRIVATATLERRALGFDQLGGVLVDPGLRGQGVGTDLMDAVRAESIRTGARFIVCGVYRRDPDVSPYYRRMGFRVIAPCVPGAGAPFPLGLGARFLARLFRVEAGKDSIRIMARRP